LAEEVEMAIKIRPIVLQDATGYRRCLGTIAKERLYGFDESMSLAAIRGQVRDNLRRKHPFLVAVDDDRIVGWAALYGSDLPSKNHCLDLGMGLLPQYREVGLGTKLLTKLLNMARGKIDSVFLTVVRKNKRARNLYRKMGFEPRGGIRNIVKTTYGPDDLMFMQKHLRRE